MDLQETILIVHGLAATPNKIKEALEAQYNIIEANNTETALNILEENRNSISLILLQLAMPLYDNLELLKVINENAALPAVPTVVIFPEPNTEVEKEALNLGAISVVNHPLNHDLFSLQINNIIARHSNKQKIISEEEMLAERYQAMLNQTNTMVIEYNLEDDTSFCSDNVKEQLAGDYTGSSTTFTEAWKKSQTIRKHDIAKLFKYVEEVLAKPDKSIPSITLPLKTRNKEYQWHKFTTSLVADNDRRNHRIIISINNIQNEKEAERSIKEKTKIIDMISDIVGVGLIVYNMDKNFSLYYIHDNFCDLLGYTRDEIMEISGGIATGIIYPPDKALVFEKATAAISKNGEYTVTYRIQKKDGTLAWFQENGKVVKGYDGISRINSIVTDISVLKSTMDTLHYQTKFDKLTGIYNTDTFYKTTHALLEDNLDTNYIYISINVERFKVINDLFGTDEGDKLLQYISSQIVDLMQGVKGTYGRIMADIFGVCLPIADYTIEQVIKLFQNRIKQYPLPFEVSLSFGIFMVESHNTPVNFMSDRANLASRTIKGNYSHHYAVYDKSMRDNILNEQLIINEMEAALKNGEFVVYFQPKFSFFSNSILGAEALVRWLHPEKGLIPPIKFIPLFEKNGFITQLDYYVWEQACIALKKWEKEGKKVLPISVNISRIHLYNPNLASTLIALVKKHDVNPKLLELEITESAYTETLDSLLKIMAELQQYGFTFLMDDFGSGYSSLNMLKDVPVDILKIDMRFLAGEDEFGKGGSILTSIVRMAKWLKIEVIAEGVETREQADFLKSIGCTMMQGYYFAKPMPLNEYEKLLTEENTQKEPLTSRSNYIGEFDHIWSTSAKNNAIFNSVIGGVGIYELADDVLEIIRVNDGYYKILNIEPQEFILPNTNIIERIHADDRKHIIDTFNEAYNSNKVTETQIRHYLPDGSIIWLHTKIRYLTGDASRSTFYVAFDDITEIRKQDLNQYFKQYGNLLESLFSEVFRIDLAENTFTRLKRNKDILGLSNDSGSIDQCHKLVLNRLHDDHKEDYLKRFCCSYIKDYFKAGHQQMTGEYKLKMKDGNYQWLSLTIVPVLVDKENNNFLCCLRNLDYTPILMKEEKNNSK